MENYEGEHSHQAALTEGTTLRSEMAKLEGELSELKIAKARSDKERDEALEYAKSAYHDIQALVQALKEKREVELKEGDLAGIAKGHSHAEALQDNNDAFAKGKGKATLKDLGIGVGRHNASYVDGQPAPLPHQAATDISGLEREHGSITPIQSSTSVSAGIDSSPGLLFLGAKRADLGMNKVGGPIPINSPQRPVVIPSTPDAKFKQLHEGDVSSVSQGKHARQETGSSFGDRVKGGITDGFKKLRRALAPRSLSKQQDIPQFSSPDGTSAETSELLWKLRSTTEAEAPGRLSPGSRHGLLADYQAQRRTSKAKRG